MKKIIAVFLCVILLFSFTGCSHKNTQTETKPIEADLSTVEGKTAALKAYLQSIYGKQILSGQMYRAASNPEITYIYSETGKLPAIMGFDMAGMEWDSNADDDIQEAIKWHKNSNGIVAFCWHWSMPTDMNDYSKGKASHRNQTSFDLIKAITEGTKENELVITHIDMIAGQLKRLEMADVPVLWRPLHEAGGGWFWWGKTAYGFKALWKILYDRLMNYHGLKNLIWVWNGQSEQFMPDEGTFDIAGYDNYSEDDSIIKETYDKMDKYTNKKMLALTECGKIPEIDKALEKGSMWLYWLTWYGDFVVEGEGGRLVAAEKWTSLEQLKENYLSRYVITLDELPLLGKENKRELPEPVQYFVDTGYIEGNTPEWKDGILRLEFEMGNYVNCQVFNSKTASGAGTIEWRGKSNESEAIVVCVVPEGGAGEYTANIKYGADYGDKNNEFMVNGISMGEERYTKAELQEKGMKSIDIVLKEGVNYMGFTHQLPGWGWMTLDYVELVKKQ